MKAIFFLETLVWFFWFEFWGKDRLWGWEFEELALFFSGYEGYGMWVIIWKIWVKSAAA